MKRDKASPFKRMDTRWVVAVAGPDELYYRFIGAYRARELGDVIKNLGKIKIDRIHIVKHRWKNDAKGAVNSRSRSKGTI